MALPETNNRPFPPIHNQKLKEQIDQASAWYSGDINTIASEYTSLTGMKGWVKRFFTSESTSTTTKNPEEKLHLPIASDIASTSADLLFNNFPTITTTDEKTNERLTQLIDENNWKPKLLEAAELCSALGSIYLVPSWVEGKATFDFVSPKYAIPEFSHGELKAVTFWWDTEDDTDTTVVWRHLERREPGLILHGLYKGTKTTLGSRMGLRDHALTSHIFTPENPDGTINLRPAGITEVPAVLVNNVMPNRRLQNMPVGRADTAGAEDLMAALDECWTSWMRDLRLGKARIIVSQDFLSRDGRGAGAAFDMDREVYSPLDMDITTSGAQGITPVQFSIRVDEHSRTANELIQRIIAVAGYSAQTFGGEGDGADKTATEISARESRSERTTRRKQMYWDPALKQVIEMVLKIDNVLNNSGIIAEKPMIEYPTDIETSMRETASTLNLLSLAKSISTESKVRMLHPDWSDEQVQAEVTQIGEEEGFTAPDPTGNFT